MVVGRRLSPERAALRELVIALNVAAFNAALRRHPWRRRVAQRRLAGRMGWGWTGRRHRR